MAAMVRSWKDVPTVILAGAMPVRMRDDPIVFHRVNDERDPPDGGMMVVIDLTCQWYTLANSVKGNWIAVGLGLAMKGSPVGGVEWRVVVRVRSEEERKLVEQGRDMLEEDEVGGVVEVEVVE